MDHLTPYIKMCTTNQNKAYRPNGHLFDIIMQLKYQFAIRIRFRISIKRLLVVLPVFVHNILKLSLTKKHMNFNMYTVPAITQCMDH